MPGVSLTRICVCLAICVAVGTSFALAASQWLVPDRPAGAVAWCLATLLLALGCAAIAQSLARRWSHDIHQIGQALRLLEAGREGEALLAASCGELTELARRVHAMRSAVSDRIRRLHETGQRLETVLSSMIEGVLVVDAQERVLLANDASRRLLRVASGDVVNRPLLEVVRNKHVRDAFVAGMRSEAPYSAQFETHAPRRHLAIGATRLPGEPCPGVVLVLHDLTELRRLENLRREFVANVSHELKTPLASIQAYAETLRLGAVNDPRHNLQFVARIEEQAVRLHELIRDMLQIARIESGREMLFIDDVPVAELIREAAGDFVLAAETKGIELVIEPFDPAVCVRADIEGLRTILTNLIDNAIKYTPSEGRVVVRAQADEEMVALETQDSGIGIAPEDQARVFERFYRVEKARTRELGGTGLGLSIVKHMALAMGGQVEVESQVGSGSVFRVRLPRSRSE